MKKIKHTHLLFSPAVVRVHARTCCLREAAPPLPTHRTPGPASRLLALCLLVRGRWGHLFLIFSELLRVSLDLLLLLALSAWRVVVAAAVSVFVVSGT